MSAYTAEQMQKVAQWLGVKSIERIGSTWSVEYFADTAAFWSAETIWSDADLFCAIDDKAFNDGLSPDLVSYDRQRMYLLVYPDENGKRMRQGEPGPDRLTAAINAVLKMLEARA